jgi:hypothetical protein
MKALCFQGKFGYLKEEIYQGFVVFCHFEPVDTEKTIINATKKIAIKNQGQLILVPFSHLDNKVASEKEAGNLFEKLVTKCEDVLETPVVVIPFGVEKEFYLYAPAKHSAVKFMSF